MGVKTGKIAAKCQSIVHQSLQSDRSSPSLKTWRSRSPYRAIVPTCIDRSNKNKVLHLFRAENSGKSHIDAGKALKIVSFQLTTTTRRVHATIANKMNRLEGVQLIDSNVAASSPGFTLGL